MSAFVPIPLGSPIPDSPHAVSCSLPTMAAVRGYEEKNPAITQRMASGYPRFVVHPFARRLGSVLSEKHLGKGRTLWLASSRKMAAGLLAHLEAAGAPGQGAQLFEAEGVHGVTHPENRETSQLAKLYLQNIGGFISSREAEDLLAQLGAGPQPQAEEVFLGDAASEVLGILQPLFEGTGRQDLLLSNCGMNAVYTAFKAVSDLQAGRGRTAWVQLGWLYLDTIAILKKFTARREDYIAVADVMDLSGLERLFAERAATIAGVMAEIPTNPLVQTPDVAALAALCRKYSVKLVLDPSLASAFSVDCFAHADMVVTSLTKYTGNEGDIIAGLLAVNPKGADAEALRRGAASLIESPYRRDLARLARQIRNTREVLGRIEESTPRVAAFLSSHPAVTEVFWAHAPSGRSNYLKIARKPEATGGVISFTLKGSLEAFYDTVPLPKGPSFGMRTTLICPFMFLAHYDLVNTPEGRGQLEANGLNPELLRLSVGIEPSADIIAALGAGLDASIGAT